MYPVPEKQDYELYISSNIQMSVYVKYRQVGHIVKANAAMATGGGDGRATGPLRKMAFSKR